MAAAAPVDRIRGTVNSGDVVRLTGHLHPVTRAGVDRGTVDPSMPMRDMVLVYQPSPEQQAELERLLTEQRNPGSPSYHQWLTPEEFGERFGLSRNDHAKVVAWLKTQHLTVNDAARGRNWVSFSGTADQVAGALHTSIHRYQVNGRTHYANITEPSLPAALAQVAGGILGLNDVNPVSSVKMEDPDYTIGTNHYMVPEDFATIYNLKPLYQAGFDGTGQSIAILGGSDLSIDDVRAFRTRYGLPANDPKFLLFGADPGVLSGEANLDVEWAGAVAPKATIYYVYATSAFTALLNAVNLNIAPVISNSYYSCEGNASPLFYRSIAQQANAQGITILSASGDGGGAGCYDQFSLFATHGALLQFPASLPEVTAVGGTQFTEGSTTYWGTSNSPTFGSAQSYIPEKAWNESVPGSIVAASTGGPSTLYAKPAWQQGPGVPDDSARDVPDVAMSAAGHDAYFIVYNGQNAVTYGTSASAPALSGVIAILNQYQVANGYQKTPGLGNINPQLYRLAQVAPSAFHDIVDGDNRVPCTQGSPNCVTGFYGYPAGPGYDMATGLGSVDANNLVTQWHTPMRQVVVNVVTSAARATINDSIDITALVGAADGIGMPTGAVDFSVGTTALGTVQMVPRGNQGAADITIPAYLLGGTGAFLLYAQYAGDTAFSGGGSSARLTIATPTGVSAIIPSVSANPVWPNSDVQGLVWQETLRLREAAGVPSLITGFSIDGKAQKLADYFPSPEIPGGTTVTSNPVTLRNLAPSPATHTFGFTGVDASGQTWSREITALFLPPPTSSAGLSVTVAPLTMIQDPTADSACQWSQQIFVDETKGLNTSLIALNLGGVSLASRISAIFGTTRLQAWGSLHGTLCWSGVTPGTSSTVQVGMSSGLSQTLQVNFEGPAASPVKITAPANLVSLAAADPQSAATASVAVSLSAQTEQWTASVFPANAATSWLKVAPLAGTGTGTLQISASGAGFGPGVYRATIVLQSANAMPATVNIPVMFVYGKPSGAVIQAIGNSANPQSATASPGMLLSIFGSQLAPSTNQAAGTPAPFSLAGVSARVNGLDAPVLYVSPTQVNIQVPYEAGAGPGVLGLHNNGQVAGIPLTIAPAAPAIFADASNNLYPQSTVAAGATAMLYYTGDGDLNSGILTGFVSSAATPPVSLIKSRLPVSVTVAGIPAFVQFYGLAPGYVGMGEVSFTVPASLKPGMQPVVITVGGVASKPVNLMVQ
jgi:uncharacterized protein (TIGR03437 family)